MPQRTGSDTDETFHADFRLSITQALGDQLLASLMRLEPAPLQEASLLGLRELPGVYQLYLDDELVYVGKADRSLPARLRQHKRKVSGRANISLENMTFCCLYVAEDFSALAPEKLLINRYAQRGEAPWNRNGFGGKDPGRRRDHTVIKENHFDNVFPADLDRIVDDIPQGEVLFSSLLSKVKKELPFNFRYQQLPSSLANHLLTIHDPQLSADGAFRLIASQLPVTWQVVALSGYVVMYPDMPTLYASARRYYRGDDCIDAVPEIAPPGDVEESPNPDDK